MATDDATPLEQKVLEAARATGTPFEVIRIDPDLADTAAFCEHYGYPPGTSANCILVASRDEVPRVAACLVLATTRLDVNKRVRKLLGVRKCSFATPELTRALTGMEIGGVTPFGLPHDMPLWVDDRVVDLDQVIVGGGSRRLKLAVGPEALRALDADVIADLAVAPAA